jgi:FkbM family methyltransferase
MESVKSWMSRWVPQPIWTRLVRSQARSLAHQVLPARVARHLYAGFPLQIEIGDKVASRWYDHDWELPTEIAAVQAHGRVKPGSRVFDIGAHQGVVALILGRLVGTEGRVIAVEADARNAAVARANGLRNEAANLLVIHAAVGAESGLLHFDFDRVRRTRDGGGQLVRAVTLDELSREHGPPDLVLVDVEGFECEVLKGSAVVLGARPDWIVEVHAKWGLEDLGGSVDDVFAHFPANAYEVWIQPGSATPATKWTRGSELPGERFFLIAVGR